MYKYDNLKLVCAVADQVNNTPILVLHSGGNRVLEAMLIAAEKQNVFLETSFSLSYYKGSSVENDIAFAYKKIGVERVLYGSDFPYVSIQESINVHHQFLEKHSFSTNDIEKIMFKNAQSLVM
jgi:predicted TIM-barrel fold metal-dependent hydrolase